MSISFVLLNVTNVTPVSLKSSKKKSAQDKIAKSLNYLEKCTRTEVRRLIIAIHRLYFR